MPKQPIVLVGMGEMGSVFARGFLRLGHPVFPVTRNMSITSAAKDMPSPRLVMVAVAESDVHDVMAQLPRNWKTCAVLLQNELLPHDWQEHHITAPTVISVWFEKKKGQDVKVIIPSPVYGPHSPLIADALNTIGIPCRELDNETELTFELVRKNVYILTTNIAGLVTGGTVSELWREHRDLALKVAGDIIKIQSKLTGNEWSRDTLIAGMVEAFDGDPDHKCMGRSAPVRLVRALAQAQELNIKVPTLWEIREKL